jgi:Xaa-Pro aminopeptidase
MLTADGCARRRQRLWESLPSPCDLLLIADPSHLVYLASYAPSPFEFRGNESAALLVMQPNRATLVGDGMLNPYLEAAHADAVVAPTWYDGKTSAPHRRTNLVDAAADVLTTIPGRRLGVEMASVPTALIEGLRQERPEIELLAIDRVVRYLRRMKDEDEIAALRRSMRAIDTAAAAMRAELQPGMTELDAFEIARRAASQSLGTASQVYGDFVADPTPPHRRGGQATTKTIKPGDLFLADFSVVVDGYRGDIATTWAMGGAGPTPEQKRLEEAVLAALAAGERLLRPDAACRLIDAAIHAEMDARGLGAFFTSHSGHGLGLGHPEPPYITSESGDLLMRGDVVTLEPSLFVPGVGGLRFEHNYLITENGAERLTTHRTSLGP